MKNYKIIEFLNGAKLVTVPSKAVNSLISIYFKIGSSSENRNNNGVTHMLEHLILNDDRLKNIKVDGFTSRELCCLKVEQDQSKTLTNLKTILNVIQSPDFKEKEKLEKEKIIVKEEMKEINQNKKEEFFNKAHKVFKDGYRFEILGSKKSLRELSLKKCINYFNSHFRSSNMVIFVSSNNVQQDIKKVIEENSNSDNHKQLKVGGYSNDQFLKYCIVADIFESNGFKVSYFPYYDKGLLIIKSKNNNKNKIALSRETLNVAKNNLIKFLKYQINNQKTHMDNIAYNLLYFKKLNELNFIIPKIEKITYDDIRNIMKDLNKEISFDLSLRD